MRKLSFFVLLFVVLFCCARAEVIMHVAITSGYLNARLNPEPKSEIVYMLSRGEEVVLTGEEVDGWAEIRYGGDFVWVSKKYLASGALLEEAESMQVWSRGRIRLRNAPDGKLIDWVAANKKVTVYAYVEKNNVMWAKIDRGYVDSAYLTRIDE